MKEFSRFIKTTGIYIIGNVLTKSVAFLMLPIYTKFLTPADYGTYDVNVAYITFLSSVLFLDIWSSVMRFMFDYENNQDKMVPIFSGVVIFLSSTVAYIIFSIVLGTFLHVEYIFWVLLYGLMANVQSFFAYVVRGFSKNSLFVISGIVGSAVTLTCNVLFIAIIHTGYQYLYISSVLGYIASVSILLFGIPSRELFNLNNFNVLITKKIFLFSLPLTINSVSWWFLTAFNRVVLTQTLSSSANGLYAVANKFSAMVQLVDQAFQMAWQEISFSKGGSDDENKDKFFSNAIDEYVKFMLWGFSLMVPFVRIVFPIFVNDAYSAAINIVPIALLATVLSSISSFLGGTLTAIKQNKYLFTTTIAGTFINIFVLIALIGILQVQAASISLAVGYLVVDFKRYILLKKYVNLEVNVSNIVMLICLCAITSVIYVTSNCLVNGIYFIGVFLLMIFFYRNKIKEII